MKLFFRFGIFLYWSLGFLCAPLLFSAEDQKQELTVEEIAKTQAAKLYISRRYEDSLKEFEKLEAAYPLSLAVKRYIASLHDSLGRPQNAIAKLKEVIRFNENDFVARRMLGDIYIKHGDLDLAKMEFEWIAAHDGQSSAVQYAQKKMNQIRGAHLSEKAKSRGITLTEFMKSEPAQLFSQGDFKAAVRGFDELLKIYPNDILILRFRAISLTRLKNNDEAIETFHKALALDPDNIAVHYYLGEAYSAAGRDGESRREFQWVAGKESTIYKTRAERAIYGGLKKSSAHARSSKKWGISVTTGYEYDTNASYKSRDDRFSVAGDQNSSRFPLTATGNYRFYRKGKLSLNADGIYAHNFYTDFPTLTTYTIGGGLSALYAFRLFNRSAYFNLRNGMSYTILRDEYFVWTYSLSPSLVFFPHKNIRSTLAYRWGMYQYHRNGFEPDLTSRDSFNNSISFLNNLYLNSKKNLYLTFGYDFERADATGKNYIKNAHGIQLGAHFPIFEKIEGDFNFRFKDSDFPKYAYDPPARRDDQYVMTASISRPIAQYFILTFFYTYENTQARNNLYEYYKNVFGASLTYRY